MFDEKQMWLLNWKKDIALPVAIVKMGPSKTRDAKLSYNF